MSSTRSLTVPKSSSTAPWRRRGVSERPSLLWTFVAFLLCAVFLIPVLWMVMGSFRPSAEIFASLSPLSWRTLFPERITLDNYIGMMTGTFGRSILNSLIVCVVSVIVGALVCAAAAYAVAVLRFRGRSVIFTLIVIGFMVPFDAIAIPLSQLFTSWGLANTWFALILPGVGNGLAIFNLRQHFRSIPESYREAAKIDGASELRVFRSIYLPLGGGALVNSGLLIFLGQWGAYLWPLLAVSEGDMQLAPVALAQAFGERGADYGAHFAGSVVLALIPAVLMFVMQKFFGGLSVSSGEK